MNKLMYVYLEKKNRKYGRILELMSEVDSMNKELNATMNEKDTRSLATMFYEYEIR